MRPPFGVGIFKVIEMKLFTAFVMMCLLVPSVFGAEDVPASSRDYVAEAAEYKIKADQGDADALFYLGGMYATGHGVAKDHSKAVELIALSANKGNRLAKKMIGVMK